MTPDQIVTAFCEAVTKKDVDRAMSLLADDVFYHNIPLEPVKGKAAVGQAVAGFLQLLGAIEIETLHQAANGNVVLNERMDYFYPPGKGRVGLPVAGIFEVRDGKIVSWRDYFDVKQFVERTGISI